MTGKTTKSSRRTTPGWRLTPWNSTPTVRTPAMTTTPRSTKTARRFAAKKLTVGRGTRPQVPARRPRSTRRHRRLVIFFKKMAIARLLSFILFFSNKYYNFYNPTNEKKWPSSIQCWGSNPQPLEHESPPITTRPGLPLKYACFYSPQFKQEGRNKGA